MLKNKKKLKMNEEFVYYDVVWRKQTVLML